MALAERFAHQIDFEYSLIDRIRVRGHVMNMQSITMLRGYFQQVRHVDWIEPADLQAVTDDFVRYVEDYATRHNIPILRGRVGESPGHGVYQWAPFRRSTTGPEGTELPNARQYVCRGGG